MYGAVRIYTPFEQPESNNISPVNEDEDPVFKNSLFNRILGYSENLTIGEDVIEGS
jgi:hypothetical protein